MEIRLIALAVQNLFVVQKQKRKIETQIRNSLPAALLPLEQNTLRIIYI